MKNLKYFRLFENISSDDLNTLGELKDIFDFLEDDWKSNINYFLEDYSPKERYDIKYIYDLNGNLIDKYNGQFIRYGMFEMPIYYVYIVNGGLSNSTCLEIFNLVTDQMKRIESVIGLKVVLFEIFFSSYIAGYYRRKFTSPELFNQYINHKERFSDFESYYVDIKLEFLLKFAKI